MTDDHFTDRPVSTSPFPFTRLLYAIGFAFVAWLVFWLVVFLAALQFVATAVTRHPNDELKHFSLRLTLYMQELLSYITLVRDERPFPIGPFPKG